MAREMNTEWNRLHEVYAGMADGELLELAAKPEELTDVAQNVLKREMAARRLEVPAKGAEAEGDGEVEAGSAFRTNLTFEASGAVSLMTLNDALRTSDACAYLEEEAVPFEVRDRSAPQVGFVRYGNGPAVAFEFVVPVSELERAKQILRERMGLFPVQEVAEADEPVDDGTMSILGCFASAEEADEVAAGLREAGFRCSVRDTSGSPEIEEEEEEYPFLVEVREVDLMKALAVIEASGEVVEGGDQEAE